jgi:hypothetical protein
MQFMSAEHVDAMNALLADAPEVRAACSELTRPYVVAYRLADGPDRQTVHWTVTFDATVRFALSEHPTPDVVMVGDWRDMILASSAGRRGASHEPSVTLEGDPDVLTLTDPALEAARTIATVEVDFPNI